MNPILKEYKRKFSLSMCKDYKIELAGMSFYKDFVNDTKGDMYPIAEKSGDACETVENNAYKVEKGSVKRFVSQFFPYASYELSAELNGGAVGFEFTLPSASASVTVTAEAVEFVCGGNTATKPHGSNGEVSVTVALRPGFFDVYFNANGKAEYFHTFAGEAFKISNAYAEFSNGAALLSVSGAATVKKVISYIDCGVSVADIRPVKYENGEVIAEDGKVFFTASARLQEGNYQLIFSWVPGTMRFELTGALFFDLGDGVWKPYLASSLIYDRTAKRWLIWTSAFECGHILCYGEFDSEPRYGVNVIDVTMMKPTESGTDISEFAGFVGDEDPDLYFDSERGKWVLGICRLDPATRKYVYVFFESGDPFTGYKFIGKAYDGCETGGCFVRAEGEIYFACGNAFDKTSEYRIYSKDGMTLADFDRPDGGFRGWGAIFPVKAGSRTRYYWLTFDRHKGSSYNWSYGNLYCFEAM